MTEVSNIDAVERNVSNLLDSLVVGSWIRGPKGEPGFWSKQVFDFFGLPACEQAPPAEVVLQQFDTAGRAQMWKAVERCGNGEAPFALEYSVRTPQGVTRRLKSAGHPVRADSGEIMIVGTLQDVSAVDALRSQVHELSQSLRRVRRSYAGDALSPRQWTRVDALIQERQGRDLSVPELASLLRLKACDFARRFKFTTGETPHQYLLRYRLKRAQEALSATDVSVAQVALDSGFFDQAHFTRHFKRRFGLTPARFARGWRSFRDGEAGPRNR